MPGIRKGKKEDVVFTTRSDRRGRAQLHAEATAESAAPKGRGAPKRGESFAEIFRAVLDMTPEELAAQLRAGSFDGALEKLPKGIVLKRLMVVRALLEFMDEPKDNLFNTFLDRVDGKVKDTVELTGPNGAPIQAITFGHVSREDTDKGNE